MSCCGPSRTERGAVALSTESGELALKEAVRAKYASLAGSALAGDRSGCACGCTVEGAADPVSSGLYETAETDGVPAGAVTASLGCGNPTALVDLKDGDVVLDLGSGGGLDVLLSARRVGPTGKAYGLDMTDEMLALALENKRLAGVTNVEFLKGEIERIPLPDASVDVVISNCVINLSSDKSRVLAEAFRVLRPGGRFAISDVVVDGDLPLPLRRSLELWVGCVAGALEISEFRTLLAAAGFVNADIEPTRIYEMEDAATLLADAGFDPADPETRGVEGRIMAAFVRATKPMT
jgi:SAM-dependent methyltransferase